MTEQEWQGAWPFQGRTWDTMLTFLGSQASPRKMRLFAVACCRRLLDRVPVSPEDKEAVEVAERFADGKASLKELGDAGASISTDWTAAAVCEAGGVEGASECAYEVMVSAPHQATYPPGSDKTVRAFFSASEAWERQAQVCLIRCIFGNPFRPLTVAPTWRTADVLRLAETIYAERAFDRLPILADALEEVGCNDAQLLGHLRGPGPHYRGCFALDAVLAKE
jgi:hypothetical protein